MVAENSPNSRAKTTHPDQTRTGPAADIRTFRKSRHLAAYVPSEKRQELCTCR